MARRHFAIVAFLLAAAAPLSAQTVATAPAPQTSSVAPAPTGPSYDAMTVAAHTPAASNALVLSPAARNGGNLGHGEALMIVGGAALLAGAVIGGTPGTIFMIGGAVVGLVGLYDYLQ